MRWVASRHPVGPDGIIPGAQSLLLPAGDDAVLALHGFGDTPQTLSYLAPALAAQGWSVHVPLLPGHGRTLPEFARSDAASWLAAARAEYLAMRAQYERVALVGLSMGGALATVLAADVAEPVGLVLIAPYLAMPRTLRWFAKAWPLATLFASYVGGRGGESIRDPDESGRNLAYGAASPRLVAELSSVVVKARAAAPRVQAPTLMVQSRNDNRIAAVDAEAAFLAIGAKEKTLVWANEGRHIITVDTGRDVVIATVGQWLAGRRAGR